MLANSGPWRWVIENVSKCHQFVLAFNKSSFFRSKYFQLIIIGFGEDSSLEWVEGNAESLSFQNDSMDGYTIAFGIRNVTHIEKVLSEAHRLVCTFITNCCNLYDIAIDYIRGELLLLIIFLTGF